MEGYSTSLYAVQGAGTAAAVGINVMGTALRALSSIGIMLVINLLIEGLSYLASADDRARESAEDALNTYNDLQGQLRENQKAIGDVASDYERLSSGVNDFGENIGLSAEEFERYNKISNQIADMFPELVQGWTDEGNAILSCKDNVEALNKAYKDKKLTAAYELMANGSDIMKTYENDLDEDDLSDWKNSKEESFLKKLVSVKDDSQALNEYLTRYSKSDASIIRDALKGAKVAPTEYGNGKDLTQAVKNHLDDLVNYYQVTAAKIDGITAKVKPLAEAYLQSDSNYIHASDQHKKVVDQIIGSLDSSFFAKYQDDEVGLYTALSQIVSDVTVNGADKIIQQALDAKARYNNNEITTGEYHKEISEMRKWLSGLAPDTRKRVSVIFDLQTDTTGRQLTEGQLAMQKLADSGISHKMAQNFVNAQNSADLDIFFNEEFLSGLKSWMSTHQKDGEEAIFNFLNQSFIGAKMRLNPITLQTLPQIYDGIKSNASLAAQAQQEMADSGRVSLDTMMSLISAGLLTENQFTKTADGFAIAGDSVELLNSALLKNYEISLQEAMNAAAAVLNTQDAEKAAHDKNTKSILEQLKAKKALMEASLSKEELKKDESYKAVNAAITDINNSQTNYKNAQTLLDSFTASQREAAAKRQQEAAKREQEAAEAAYKERIAKEFSNLEHRHNMGKLSEKQYLDELERLNNRYYRNNADFASEYQSNLERIRNGRLQLTRDNFAKEQKELQRQRDLGKLSEWNYLQKLESLNNRYYKNKKDFAEDYQQTLDEILQSRMSLYQEAYDQLNSLVDKQVEIIKSEKEAEKKVLQDKLNNLKEFYDKQKQMLRDQADEDKYEKEQAEKRKTVTELELEIQALSRSTSARDRKLLAEKQQELADAREELRDFENERALDEAEKAIDLQYEKDEERINKDIEKIDQYLENQYKIQQDALNELKQIKNFSKQSALYKEMRDWNRQNGTGKDADIDALFSNVAAINKAFGNGTFGGAMSYLQGQIKNTKRSFAGGTAGAPAGLALVDEQGYEVKLSNPSAGKYQFMNDGDIVFTRAESRFLKRLTGSGGASLIGERLAGLLRRGANALSPLTAAAMAGQAAVAIRTGDIVINGDATKRTVAQIKAAQKDMTYQILRQFQKLK